MSFGEGVLVVAWFGKQLYCLFGPILARVLSLQYCGDLLIIRLYFVTLYNIFSYLQSFVALAILQKLAAQFQEGRCVTLTTALCCVLPLSPWRGNPRNWDAHEAEEGAPLFICVIRRSFIHRIVCQSSLCKFF